MTQTHEYGDIQRVRSIRLFAALEIGTAAILYVQISKTYLENTTISQFKTRHLDEVHLLMLRSTMASRSWASRVPLVGVNILLLPPDMVNKFAI